MKKLARIIIMISLAVVLTLIVTGILGVLVFFNGMDGCLLRYNEDGLSEGDSVQESVRLEANGVIDGSYHEEEVREVGKWKKLRTRAIKGSKYTLRISGKVSLCKSYLPKMNLNRDDNQLSIYGKQLPISLPRIDEPSSLYQYGAPLIFRASMEGMRNLVHVLPGDEIEVRIGNNNLKEEKNVSVEDIFSKKSDGSIIYQSQECKKSSNVSYSPICGVYAPYKTYYSHCEYEKNNCKAECSGNTCKSVRVLDRYICRCSYGPNGTLGWTNWGECTNKCVFTEDVEKIFKTVPEGCLVLKKSDIKSYNDENLISCYKDASGKCTSLKDYKQEKPVCSYEDLDKRYTHDKFWFSASDVIGLKYRIQGLSDGVIYDNIEPNNNYIDDNPKLIYKGKISQELGGDGANFELGFLGEAGKDRVGGYIIYVKHTKCVKEDGLVGQSDYSSIENGRRGEVQYIITPGNQDPNIDLSIASKAQSIEFNDHIGEISSAYDTGDIWMRINNHPDDYKDSTGNYSLQIFSSDKQGTFLNDIINPLVGGIKDMMSNAASKMFQNMTCYGMDKSSCTNFFSYIRAILTIYVAYLGISFLLGNIKFNQEELVIRIVKIIIVAGLINEDTFRFFSQNILDLLISYTDTIISNISGYSGYTYEIPGSSKTILVPFGFLDRLMTKIFVSKLYRAQIMAQLSFGLMGFATCMIIIVATILMIIAVLRSIAIYLMAFLAVAVLIGLAPIFLSLMLFDFTKYIFDNWIKYFIRYLLEPVIVLAGLIILFQLFEIYSDMVLGYSVCWKCAFPFRIPMLQAFGTVGALLNSVAGDPSLEIFCISWLVPWGHDVQTVPFLTKLYDVVALFMIAFAMKGYTDFAELICTQLLGTSKGTSSIDKGQDLANDTSKFLKDKFTNTKDYLTKNTKIGRAISQDNGNQLGELKERVVGAYKRGELLNELGFKDSGSKKGMIQELAHEIKNQPKEMKDEFIETSKDVSKHYYDKIANPIKTAVNISKSVAGGLVQAGEFIKNPNEKIEKVKKKVTNYVKSTQEKALNSLKEGMDKVKQAPNRVKEYITRNVESAAKLPGQIYNKGSKEYKLLKINRDLYKMYMKENVRKYKAHIEDADIDDVKTINIKKAMEYVKEEFKGLNTSEITKELKSEKLAKFKKAHIETLQKIDKAVSRKKLKLDE